MSFTEEQLDSIKDMETNVTEHIHHSLYQAIQPTRPALSQKGRTVLVTGGGSGIGKSIALAFAQAQAATVIIAGRRVDVLETAAAELRQKVPQTQFLVKKLDQSETADVDALWNDLVAHNIVVDVLILNAVRFSDPQTLLALGSAEVWKQFETNVRGALQLAEKFLQQKTARPRFLVHVTTVAMNAVLNPIVALRPAYALTKAAATYTFKLLADAVSPDEVQIVNYHPGLIYSDVWTGLGVPRDRVPFDDDNLPAGFAVWAASKEAKFLHGRYAQAQWDVTELPAVVAKGVAKHPEFLRVSVVGINETKLDL